MLLNKLKRRFYIWSNYKKLNSELKIRAEHDAFDFIYSQSSNATVLFEDKQKLRNELFAKRLDKGIIMEFGVFKGNTINKFAKLLIRDGDEREIYGFDSFVGFSEAWGGGRQNIPFLTF